MFFVSYDFADNRARGKFSKFLKKFGRRIQYSVFEIKNSKRALDNILKEIDMKYKKIFCGSDSIIIFPLCESCKKKVVRYGSAENEESDLVIFK